MNYHNITHDDQLNGDGFRVVLWVSGCSHACKGCQNPETWDSNNGIDFDDSAKQEIFEELEKDYISGITYSGGDPMFLSNREAILNLSKEIKQKFPNKTIWMYTGYLYNDLKNNPILNYIDVLIEGMFEIDNISPDKHWVGSCNQRVIDVKESLKTNSIVLHE